MSGLSIEFPAQGDVLSRHDGQETAEGLRIVVKGRCGPGPAPTVNGRPADRSGESYQAPVLLAQPRSEIAVCCGDERQSITVLYDRKSFPRYRFSVDDVIWCFTEVARGQDRYASIFDHWFFAVFKKLHKDYGACVQMNIYYEDPQAGFDLTQFPDRYKAEWRDNAQWLRLSFHARSNDCYGGRIYRDTSREQIREDHDRVEEQIVRFAGEETLCRGYTTLHWAETNRDCALELRQMGVRGLTGRFGVGDSGKPFTTRYYFDDATNTRLHGRNMWYDPSTDLYFVNCPRFLNNVPVALVAFYYDRLLDGTASRRPFDAIDFLVHEEHFWRGFMGGRGFKPDNVERCTVAAMWACERGLKPVSFEPGLAGNVWT